MAKEEKKVEAEGFLQRFGTSEVSQGTHGKFEIFFLMFLLSVKKQQLAVLQSWSVGIYLAATQ